MDRQTERRIKRLALTNQLAALQRAGEPELNVRREQGLRKISRWQARALDQHREQMAALEAEVDTLLAKEVLTADERHRLDVLEQLQDAAKQGLARFRTRH